MDEPWDSEHNSQFHAKAPDCYRCPSGNPPQTASVPAPAGSFYSVVDGPESAFWGTETRPMPPKPSDTIVLVERRTPVNWMDPSREISFETACKGINVDAMGISSCHPGGVNVAFADGSVKFLPDSMNGETLKKMLTLDKKSEK